MKVNGQLHVPAVFIAGVKTAGDMTGSRMGGPTACLNVVAKREMSNHCTCRELKLVALSLY
jgi:hypothetical protein